MLLSSRCHPSLQEQYPLVTMPGAHYFFSLVPMSEIDSEEPKKSNSCTVFTVFLYLAAEISLFTVLQMIFYWWGHSWPDSSWYTCLFSPSSTSSCTPRAVCVSHALSARISTCNSALGVGGTREAVVASINCETEWKQPNSCSIQGNLTVCSDSVSPWEVKAKSPQSALSLLTLHGL